MNGHAPSREDHVVDDDEPPPAPPQVLVADERTGSRDTPADLGELSRVLAGVLAAEGAPEHAEASLTLVDPQRIADLKSEHLGGDGAATDVLSFPVDGTAADAEMVGDVVLCPEVAAAQADTHAGTLEDELALLVVHGGLHLAGWDHDDGDAQRAMWARERELLAALGRTPARDPWADGPDSHGAAP